MHKLNCDSYGRIANWTNKKEQSQQSCNIWDCRKSFRPGTRSFVDFHDWGVAQLAAKTLRENGACLLRCLRQRHRTYCSKRQPSCSLNAFCQELPDFFFGAKMKLAGGRGQLIWAHSTWGWSSVGVSWAYQIGFDDGSARFPCKDLTINSLNAFWTTYFSMTGSEERANTRVTPACLQFQGLLTAGVGMVGQQTRYISITYELQTDTRHTRLQAKVWTSSGSWSLP